MLWSIAALSECFHKNTVYPLLHKMFGRFYGMCAIKGNILWIAIFSHIKVKKIRPGLNFITLEKFGKICKYHVIQHFLELHIRQLCACPVWETGSCRKGLAGQAFSARNNVLPLFQVIFYTRYTLMSNFHL